METAIILCEDGFGKTRGKTAAGLVRHSLRFKILGIVDSEQAGKDAGEVLDAYMQEHPDATAPAFLLLGAEQARRKDYRGAELSLMQSAAYYPKQARALSDLFDPYEARSFLRATREGGDVLHQYESTGHGHRLGAETDPVQHETVEWGWRRPEPA